MEDYESALLQPVAGLRVGLAPFPLPSFHAEVESAVNQAVNAHP